MHRATRSGVLLLLLIGLPPVRGAEPEEKLSWSISGQARFRPEWRDDADLDRDIDDDRRQGLMRLRIGLTVSLGETYRLFVQAQDSRVAGEETTTAANERNLDVHQGYLELKPARARGLSLALGRQEWKYGDERLIGAFGWDNVGRSFDGLRARYARSRFFLDGFVARVTNRTLGGGTDGSDLLGLYAHAAPRDGSAYEGYLLSFSDNVAAAGEAGALADSRVDALGARAKDRFGPFDFVVEAVVQRGEFRGDDLSARAAAAQAGWSWGETSTVRALAGYDYATGDEDPADGEREEFFNFFPTNHAHYGYADYEGWRNIRSPYLGASLTRGRHFVQAKAHRFLLEEERGAWKDAGGNVLGFDPQGASGTHVGLEVDVTYRFRWSPSATLQAGLSRFEPGRFARLTRGEDPSHWGYLMLTWGF